ncbi:hypothetical protein D047_1879B, partial [Vibrio parahaemolyticus VPTS-2010_2]
SRFVLK